MMQSQSVANAAATGLRPLGVLAFALVTGCATAATGTAPCIPTQGDALGPFYVAGTVLTENLNRFGKLGDPLFVEGQILSSVGGHPPIADANVEVWQTDGNGDYHPQNDGHVDDYADADIDMRGSVRTNELGIYNYWTVVPGGYFPRPRHFHYRITAPGHQTLVTQLYISGDGLVRQPGGECRHAPLEAGERGLRYGAPAIYLQPE